MQCLSQGARGCLIFVPREQLLPDICFVRQVGDQYLSEQVKRCRKFVSEAVVSQYLFQRRVVRLPNTYFRRQAVCDICLRGQFMRVSSSDAMLMSCVDLMLMACFYPLLISHVDGMLAILANGGLGGHHNDGELYSTRCEERH